MTFRGQVGRPIRGKMSDTVQRAGNRRYGQPHEDDHRRTAT
jgi:hypothetical protein